MNINWNIKHLATCPSTNSFLKQNLQSGEDDIGSVIITDKQTHGRGRYDRIWISPKGNLSFSLAVPAPKAIDQAYQLNLIAALSLVQTIKSNYYIDVSFKWPNDVLIKNHKLCGILSELVVEKNAVVIGMGINLNSLPQDFPNDLQPTLTTLRYETKTTQNPSLFIDQFLTIFKQNLETYLDEGLKAFQSMLYANMAWIQKDVMIYEDVLHPYKAKILGLSDNGFLKVVTQAGAIKEIVAADVRLA